MKFEKTSTGVGIIFYPITSVCTFLIRQKKKRSIAPRVGLYQQTINTI